MPSQLILKQSAKIVSSFYRTGFKIPQLDSKSKETKDAFASHTNEDDVADIGRMSLQATHEGAFFEDEFSLCIS